MSLWNFLEQVSLATAVPAGGSAGAVTGAMAAALLVKMGRLALRREGVSLAHDLVIEAEALRRCLITFADADAQTYEAAAASSRSEEALPEEVEAAWQEAVSVPLQIAVNCNRLLELAARLQVVGLAAADVRAVIVLARACLRVQLLNAQANLSRVTNPAFRRETEARLALVREKSAWEEEQA
jgi:formiminotetrahydrofolate cyclodeaminase